MAAAVLPENRGATYAPPPVEDFEGSKSQTAWHAKVGGGKN